MLAERTLRQIPQMVCRRGKIVLFLPMMFHLNSKLDRCRLSCAAACVRLARWCRASNLPFNGLVRMQRLVIFGFLSRLLLCSSLVAQSVPDRPQTPGSTASPSQPGAPAISRVETSLSAASTAATPAIPHSLGEAKVLARRGDFDAAIQKYQQLLQERPDSPDAYADLSRVYLKKKDVTRANETVTKGLQIANFWPVHVALGEVYFRQGKIHEAETEWVNVLNSGHEDARAYLGLARVRWAIAMNKSAKTMIDKAHELDPEDPDVTRSWIGTLRRSERIKYYESYLGGENNSDADERADLEGYLSYLKQRAKQHVGSCRLVSKVKATETPLVRLLMDPTHLRGYGLSVELNGTKTKLLLDTGAGGIVVNHRLAERVGITKLTESQVWGVGDKGRRKAYIGTANSIRIGELEFQDCPVEVLESRSVAGEEGLIGADVFENFLVEIDFPGEKLKLGELSRRPGQDDQPLALKNPEDDPDDQETSTKDAGARAAVPATGPQDRYIAPEMQSYTRVYRFGHDLLVPTRIGETPYKLFVLDTGALENFISPEAAREVTKVHGDSDVTLKGISGSVKNVYSANKAVLQFGHLRQENQDMLSFDTSTISQSEGTEISGFLGFAMLRSLDIKIDYRDALIDFAYDPRRLKHF